MKNHPQYQTTKPPQEGRLEGLETYLAPPPPSQGRIVGVDCHPDTFTAAVLLGTHPATARQIECRADMSLETFLAWAAAKFDAKDLFVLEAGSNSFEIHRRLTALGRRALVLESAHVGRHAKRYADNDKIAATRIARVYLAGDAPCVWVPDERTRQRRELLHAYRKAVADHTAAVNSLKGYLNQFTVRCTSRNLAMPRLRQWVMSRRGWSGMECELLEEYLDQLTYQAQRRERLRRLIAREVQGDALMLRCMRLLGIGVISAFGLMAVIGDIGRFAGPQKLVAYLGLNPGQRESGRGKRVRLGVGNRGRGDVRALLTQGAQAVLRMGKASKLGQWGMKLLLRKGNRNTAVTAVARKLAVQVWHLLSGHEAVAEESARSVALKFKKLTVTLGKKLRKELGLLGKVEESVELFLSKSLTPPHAMTS